MTHSMLNWPVWISKPLWVLASAQLVPMVIFSWLGIVLALSGGQQRAEALKQQIDKQYAAIRHIQQQLGTMPALTVLTEQLAGVATETAPFHADMPAQRLSALLSQSGASLLSWRPDLNPVSANREAWQLTFSADYPALLRMLRKFIAQPHILKIEHLAMKSTEGALHIDMTWVKPMAERREEGE
ncbi:MULTISPECIES: hypothetical protein [unclassified Brenneria]|uniref:hypothetical protein n=1 Tax=unclassified Brenneria TaxID=2634434 RepID=UPI001555B539|nr:MULTISPECIES: hypothetical protein [unclassified Brenneria]MBJ7222970.1 hypothetical protein [Brenneria sp. L3-3C-1]MEE3644209.1 hypothetical protein [Brenneria sp. L3_3C_1]MEE3652433.1 hypothetical protein [Brenneria sp. HEZEL_4_2_4]NPD02390.1 hypothetical protein [Brenneria sp. hezel4-2-4]